MFTDTITNCVSNAARIARLSANNPRGFWVSSAM
ncbi:nitrite transporter NirC, partial [Escherichia coli]